MSSFSPTPSEANIINYDVIRDSSFMGHSVTKEEIEKMKDEGLEIDLENEDENNLDVDEEIKVSVVQEENEKKEFYENLLRSPYPQSNGKFSDCAAFKDRCRLMQPVQKDKIYKYIIRPGNGRQVTASDAVLFNINAFIVESYDEPFDSTFARKKPLLSKLNRVLKGYALSLLTMKVGELSEFAIHRSLGYGELGCPPRIPPA